MVAKLSCYIKIYKSCTTDIVNVHSLGVCESNEIERG